MMNNVFWVKVEKQDILDCLKAAGFDVLFKYQDAPDLYAIDEDTTGIDLAGMVLYDTEMLIWLAPAHQFSDGVNCSKFINWGIGLSKRFSSPVCFGDIDFGDALNEKKPPVLYSHQTYKYVELDRPRIHIDLNEICGDDNLYYLSQEDIVFDTDGKMIHLEEGMHVFLYDDDEDDNGLFDPILAEAVVEKNRLSDHSYVKWLARLIPINNTGISME